MMRQSNNQLSDSFSTSVDPSCQHDFLKNYDATASKVVMQANVSHKKILVGMFLLSNRMFVVCESCDNGFRIVSASGLTLTRNQPITR